MCVWAHIYEIIDKVGVDPYKVYIWNTSTPLRHEDVSDYLRMDRLEAIPYSSIGRLQSENYNHAARVAYLVQNPDFKPIELEIVHPEGRVHLNDGWHLVAAALYKAKYIIGGSVFVPVYISGYIDYTPFEVWGSEKTAKRNGQNLCFSSLCRSQAFFL